jgi:peroxiredoxin Q/BCP
MHMVGNSTLTSALMSTAGLFGGGKGALAVGDPAPDFTLYGADGASHTLEQYKGKQAVVLAWFPRAFTPG